ncbi:hypothetical protein A2955_00500 [Candidatus Woesebacteria bacterium RIFCSPLOWO2_01_FULL_37_19]|uniref:DUF218 domain-containing protein n=1 Tax=Candidatus Woesebacteria bacterium RIFCSPLOWO2_01_FULL_37_19 TaxID=1802514 RepID=A0A1F8B718_9BACT|nr:MAG: hypothetical protein A2955_00500 [Candidatus Woesebacteria bacterium RIFCSPLOWO2_01_FULL_37_19]
MIEAQTLDKEALYKEILGGKSPDAIFILSGGTVKRERGYTSAAYTDTQGEYGSLGGKARVIAAAELAKYFPETRFVMTATYFPTPEDPSQSSIMASELIKLGASVNQIVTEEFSKTSYDELSLIVKLCNQNDWKQISVLTNKYHVPRASEMLSRLDELASNKQDEDLLSQLPKFREEVDVTFSGAEDFLLQRSPHYQKLLDELEGLPDYKKRLEVEERGLEALKSGTYGKAK